MDSRPTWSVDGSRIAFLRDDSSDLDIWVLDIETGDVQPIVETDAIELDPIYSSDGEFLYYSSGQAGTLDIWRFQLATAERMPVTSHRGIEIRPLPLDGQSLVFLSKGRGGPDRLVYSNRETGLERTLRTQSIMSQTHPGLSPDGKTLAVNWPSPDGYDLYLVDWNDDDAIRLNARSGLPISPAFSHDGKTVYFVEANDELEFELFAVPATGGKAKRVPIRSWDWGVPTGRVVIRTTRAESASPLAARLHVADANGHPALPASSSMPHFDGVHGKVYFYSPGVVSVEVPAGEVRIEASHGFFGKDHHTDGTGRAGLDGTGGFTVRVSVGTAPGRLVLRRPPLPYELRGAIPLGARGPPASSPSRGRRACARSGSASTSTSLCCIWLAPPSRFAPCRSTLANAVLSRTSRPTSTRSRRC